MKSSATRRALTRRVLAGTAACALSVLGLSSTAAALPGAADHSDSGKQTICHGTNSNNNPYVVNTPNKNGDLDGHAGHTGPVWNATLKAQHIAWGDIIPPFDYEDKGVAKHFDGLNWDADGQAIFRAGCQRVTPPQLSLSVVKSNDANGDGTYTDSEVAVAVGASVPFIVTVKNTSADSPVKIDSMVDVVGNNPIAFACTPSLIGTVLAPGASASCGVTLTNYSPAPTTTKTNTVTVNGHQGPDNVCQGNDPSCVTGENAGNTVTASDTSSVSTVLPAQPHTLSLSVVKTNDANKDGTFSDSEQAAAAGQDVTYRVVVTNTSGYETSLDGITDKLGNAAAAPVTCTPALPATLAAGASATCDFTLTASSPAAGTSVTDTVVVSGHETADPSNTVTGTDTATVSTPAPTGGGGTGSGTETENPPVVTPPVVTPPVVTPPVETPITGGGGSITPPITGGGGTVTLPHTGASVREMLAIAISLLLTGLGLQLMGRRRTA